MASSSDINPELLRLASFEKWDVKKYKAMPSLLAKAGFTYTGHLDIVECHFCQLRLENWESGEKALERHAMVSPACPYLQELNHSVNPPQNLPTDSQLHEAVDNERTDNLRYENVRLATFVSWPSNAPLPAEEMAQAGFVYLGSGDRVQCVFCEGVLQNWSPGDSAIDEHRRRFPNCGFVRANPGNIVMPSPHQHLTQRGQDAQATIEMPHHPEFSTKASRLKTFRNWPQASQNPREMAGCGFFSTGPDDTVKCFFCGGSLDNWQGLGDPWTEHAKHFKECGYLKRKKGQDFIASVTERLLASQQSADQEIEAVQDEVNNIDNNYTNISDLRTQLNDLRREKRCKVCLKEDLFLLFLYCGHVVCCSLCALHLRTCPVCRGPIRGTIRVTFAGIPHPLEVAPESSSSDGPSSMLNDIRDISEYYSI